MGLSAGQVKQLNMFHHRCIRFNLCISNKQQWDERITMAEVREWWGDEDLKIQKRMLEWLGNLARMQDHRLPKSVLFGYLNLILGVGHAGNRGM